MTQNKGLYCFVVLLPNSFLRSQCAKMGVSVFFFWTRGSSDFDDVFLMNSFQKNVTKLLLQFFTKKKRTKKIGILKCELFFYRPFCCIMIIFMDCWLFPFKITRMIQWGWYFHTTQMTLLTQITYNGTELPGEGLKVCCCCPHQSSTNYLMTSKRKI